MRHLQVMLLAAFGLVCIPGLTHAKTASECLLSLTATADGVSTNQDGATITATAGAGGSCAVTLTACLNDASLAGCTTGEIKKFKVFAAAKDSNLTGLQQTLQGQLPTSQQMCAQASVTVALKRSGKAGKRKIKMSAVATDRRSDADGVTVVCNPSTQTPGAVTPTPTPGGTACAGTTFNSTFESIQKVIFENHSCTQSVCHGSAGKAGGLDLSPDVAYQNLIEVASSASTFNRVQPGDQNRSFLWLKLAAKTDPSLLPPGVQVAGAPMPNNLPAISSDELEALRLWIYSGAPQTGTVAGTQSLLNACLPPPEPILIKPLDPPAAGQGVQFVMPPWKLPAHSEHEICFATYYDITAQVPPQFRDPSGTYFRFDTNDLRQDPQSHHLILNHYVGDASKIHDPSFGTWTCNGGTKDGQTCEPTDLTSCGAGICTSSIQQSFACVGFGPGSLGAQYYAIGGAQKAEASTDYVSGVFAQVPMKGILFWNSHAFDLTDQDTVMHAWLNYGFAKNPVYPAASIFDTSKIFAENALPYTTQILCNDYVLPQGAELFNLSSHTHKRGKHFSVTLPSGASIYDSFVYNDPASLTLDPPMLFSSPDSKQRTLHYCSLYNNGVAADGSPDPNTVTRRSKTPDSAKQTIGLCSPVACAAGKIGAPCGGVGDDHTCDSAPGANDGSCDACRITGGESTENEMFILIGQYYVPSSGSAAAATTGNLRAAPALDAFGHSTSTELILPPQIGCSSSHAGHAGHQAH